jgi:hypothetical protein
VISDFVGIIISFVAVGFTLHFVLLVWQLFFGFDGRAPWDGDHRFTVDQEKERWWVY